MGCARSVPVNADWTTTAPAGSSGKRDKHHRRKTGRGRTWLRSKSSKPTDGEDLRRNETLSASDASTGHLPSQTERPTLSTAYSDATFLNSSQKSLYSYAAAASVVNGRSNVLHNPSRHRMLSFATHGDNESLFDFSLDGYNAYDDHDGDNTITSFDYHHVSAVGGSTGNSRHGTSSKHDKDDQSLLNHLDVISYEHNADEGVDAGDDRYFYEDQMSLLGPTGSTVGILSPMIDDLDGSVHATPETRGVQLSLPPDLMRMPKLSQRDNGQDDEGVQSKQASYLDGVYAPSAERKNDNSDEHRDPPPTIRHRVTSPIVAGQLSANNDQTPSIDNRRKNLVPAFSSIWHSNKQLSSCRLPSRSNTDGSIPMNARNVVESLAQRYVEREVKAPSGELGIACRCRKKSRASQFAERQGIVVDAMDENSPLGGVILPGDVILQIDGKDTDGMSMVQFNSFLIESWGRPRLLVVQTDTTKSFAYRE